MSEDLDASFRLPTLVVPDAYRLKLEPDLDAATFDGSLEIDVTIVEPTTVIVLNANDLEIDDASAKLADGTMLAAAVSIDTELERATLAFDRVLETGRLVVRLSFRGVLNDLLAGFYRATFNDADGVEHVIATTQLCVTDARRMFPCFDEPAFKATFAITVVVPEHLDAYSNSPITSATGLGDGRREVVFSPTMRMSTYLVALVVGPFARGRIVDVDGVPLSVVSTPDKVDLGRFALEVASHALRFYADYFGVPYPGDKVDLVGIPDFAYGAMENLGCITFRETVLLIDPSTASQRELQDVAMVVAHELAHMWFGDLVTMQWWEGIWLNEAFATFLMYLCADSFRTQWRLWERFNTEREAGLEVDGLHATRPIEFAVRTPAEALSMLDAITYRKGAAVLRMLEQYLGEEVYRDGIRQYLHDHAYANTTTSDLWDALEAASGEPVGEVMATWIYQGGHPTVRLSAGSISQSPFAFGPATGPSAIGTSWVVPLRVRRLGETQDTTQLLGATPVAHAPGTATILNAGGAGAYRSSYSSDQLSALATQLSSLTEIERAVVLGDTWALTRAGSQTLGDFLVLAGSLGTLVEPSSWSIVEQAFDLLARIATGDERAALQSRSVELFAPVLASLGWEPSTGEPEQAPLVRAAAIRVLGGLAEDPSVRTEAASRFDSGVVDGDLAGAIVSVVAAIGRPGDLDVMLARIRDAHDPQTEDRYRRGMAQIADKDLALRTLANCFEWFRTQDVPYVLVQLMGNPVAGKAVWEKVTATWDETRARIPAQLQFSLGIGISGFVDDAEFAARVAAFHRTNVLESGQPLVEQAVERMLHGVAFAERVRPGLLAQLGGERAATQRADASH
jgi:puromycin-sensitive aminopeptidase